MLPRTMRNEYMGLTSGKKRAMKKVGYHIFVYKIIPLLIAHELPQFKSAKSARTCAVQKTSL